MDHGTESNPALRLLRWYLSPLHRTESVLRLWFHGANAVLSMAVFVATATLLMLAVGLTPFCGVGLLFLYFECVAVRHFVAADTRCCAYLFGGGLRSPMTPIVAMTTPHSASMMGRLREYVGDPHTVSMALYFLFLKLPMAIILSGSSLVMLSGVCSILMSPLVYWIDVDYFRSERYCLFGTTTETGCSGWAISSFSETFIAALAFAPALPLTLHLSNATAKLLHSFNTNALSMHSAHSMHHDALQQPLHQQSHSGSIHSPHQPMVYGNMNMNGGNMPYR